MMGGALRILQVGELRLDKPVKGDFSTFPRSLQSHILNAKFFATDKLFAAAITERVDLVLLAGALAEQSGGSRPFWFLHQHFKQLGKHGIKVVCVEATDQFLWPADIPIPDNVHIITRSQSIGFRVSNNHSPIEFEWETAGSAEAYDVRNGINLRLKEVGGRVVSVSYSTQELQAAKTLPVHCSQGELSNPDLLSQGTLIELCCQNGVKETPVQTEVVSWSSIERRVNQSTQLKTLKNQLIQDIENSEVTRGKNAIPSLLTISIKSHLAKDIDLTHEEMQTLLREVQQTVFARNLSIWPYRILLDGTQSAASADVSSALKVAFSELAATQLEDVYENLDLHVLDFESQAFETSKRLASLRLSHLLNESCL